MKRFKVTSPEGGSFFLTSQDDAPPSEQELEEVFGSKSSQSQIEQKGIDFRKTASEAGKALFAPSSQQVSQAGLDVIQRGGMAGLQDIYGQGKEYLLNKVPQEFEENVGQGITSTFAPPPIHGVVPKLVNQAIGKLGTGVGFDIGVGLATPTTIPKIARGVAGTLAKRAGRLTKKAQDISTYILPPEKQRFTQSLRFGNVLPEVEQPTQVIRPVKTYEELASQLEESAIPPMKRRAEVLENLSPDVERSQLDKLGRRIKEARKSPQGEKESTIFERVYTNEVDNLNNLNPEQLKNPNFLEGRKEYYQGLADKLRAYSGSERISSLSEAYRELASGYQAKLESLSSEIAKLNRQFQGRSLAAEKARELSFKEKTTPPEKFSEEVIKGLRGGTQSTLAAVFRGIAEKIPGIRKLAGRTLLEETKKISRLRGKAERSKGVSDLLNELFSKEPKSAREAAQKLLPGRGERLALPMPEEKFIMLSPDEQLAALSNYQSRVQASFRPKEQLLLPESTGGILIEPSFYGGKKVPDIKFPFGKPGKTGMEAQVRASLRSLAARRKK